MNNTFLKSFFCIILSTMMFLGIFSCKKSNDSVANGFTWTYMGKNYSANLDTAFISASLSVKPYFIIVGNGTSLLGLNRRFGFNLTSFNIGTYTFGAGTGNSLSYIDDAGDDLVGSAGKLNITANANNLLTGNFSATVTDVSSGVGNPISGNFVNMSIRP